MTDIVKKPKKTLTPQRLEQLALARKKALEIRQAGAVLKMEAKIANITQTSEIDETPPKQKVAPGFHPTPPEEIKNKIIKADLVENPIVEEVLPDFSPRVDVHPPMLSRQPTTLDEDDDDDEVRAPALKPTAPKNKNNAERGRPRIKTKIVIEQSSDDEDEFHPHEHVIFVKRKSKNDSKAKVVPAATPAPPTSPVRGQREHIVLEPPQSQRQMPTFPLPNTMSDFVNAGFSNHRKYY